MRNKKNIISILGIILIVLISFTALLFTNSANSKKEEEIVEPNIIIKNVQQERETWLNNKNINEDYVGEIKFESNLINKSFVQAKDIYDKNGNLYHFYNEDGSLASIDEDHTGNDVYLWTNWKDMSYDYNIEGGSVFMDYRNSLDDQNIIIYGHHFSEGGGNDPDRIKAFTPLEILLNEDNYYDNNKVSLILDNETRTYELVCVYVFDTNDNYYLDNLQYYRTDYNYDEFNDVEDESYYSNYIDALDSVKLYDTGVELTTDDKTLTIQTCISGSSSMFEICVFKQLNIDCYEDY